MRQDLDYSGADTRLGVYLEYNTWSETLSEPVDLLERGTP